MIVEGATNTGAGTRAYAIPAQKIGECCGEPGCDDLALYAVRSWFAGKLKRRRPMCSDHYLAWEQAEMSKTKKPLGRPKSAVTKRRVHFTIGGLALEILDGLGSEAEEAGAAFNASRFVEDAIRHAHADGKFRAAVGNYMTRKAEAPVS